MLYAIRFFLTVKPNIGIRMLFQRVIHLITSLPSEKRGKKGERELRHNAPFNSKCASGMYNARWNLR